MYLEPYIYSAAGQSRRLIFIIDNLRFVSIDDYKIIDNIAELKLPIHYL